MSQSYEVNEDLVADVKSPSVLPVAFVNTIVTKCGETYEVFIKFGKKMWLVTTGDLTAMNLKRDRIVAFIRDPFAPAPTSLEDFVEMAKRL